MKAPSEKHLEDYLWAHPEALGMVGIPPQYGDDFPIYRWWFRQFRVTSGIVDLIGIDWRVCGFELKKGTLTAQSLTQLMRYMFDIKSVVDRILMDSMGNDIARDWVAQYWSGDGFGPDRLTRGVLIGHDIEDNNLLYACNGCGVDVIPYDFDNGSYTFEEMNNSFISITEEYHDSILTTARGAFSEKFFEFYRDDILKYHKGEIEKHNANFNAVRVAEDHLENGGDS